MMTLNSQRTGLPTQIAQRLDTAETAAATAAKILIAGRIKGGFSTSFKSPYDLVTSIDLASERAILEILKRECPDDLILSEEASPTLGNRDQSGKSGAAYTAPLWVIDPIDGTMNYAHGLRETAISIAYCEQGIPVLGIVECPFVQETFIGIRGYGAWLNGEPIRASVTTDISHALVATGFPSQRDPQTLDKTLARVRKVLTSCRDIRRAGAASIDICQVACGRLTAFFEDIFPWDIAAGTVIAEEAGAIRGRFHDRLSDDYPATLDATGYMISAPGIFTALTELIKK